MNDAISITIEKPYECQVCGQRFRVKGDHTAHLKIHAKRGECSLVTATGTNNLNFQLPIVDLKNEINQAVMGLSQ